MERYVPLFALAGAVLVLFIAMVVLERLRTPVSVLRAEGRFFDVQRVGPILVRRRTGAMVHTTRTITTYRNDIHFEGGAVLYDIPGVFEFPKPGTWIRLYSDGRNWSLHLG